MLRSTIIRNAALANSRKQAQNMAVRSAFSSVADDTKEEEGPGLMARLASDYKVQLPVAFLAVLPLMQHEILVFTEETQLLGCFGVFVATVYSQAGGAIGKALDAKGENIIAAHSAQEEQVTEAVKSLMATHHDRVNVLDDMKELYKTNKQLLDMVAETKTYEFQHQMRAELVKKLDSVVAADEQFKAKTQALLVEKATNNVKERFSNKALQAKTLNEALELAANPGKQSDDVIKKLYGQYFAGVTKTLESQKGPMELPANIVEAAKAEVLASRVKGGNTDKDVSGFSTKLSLF